MGTRSAAALDPVEAYRGSRTAGGAESRAGCHPIRRRPGGGGQATGATTAGMWDGGGADGEVLGGRGGGFRPAVLRAGERARAGKEMKWRLGIRGRWLVLDQMHLVM